MNNDEKHKIIKPAISITILMIVLCGLIYPLVITGFSQLVMPSKANGSLITVDGVAVGSDIVGQEFTEPYFFHSRPSAVNYNTYEKGEEGSLASGSNNYGASNPALLERVESEIETILAENPGVEVNEIPVDMITQSGSGLDPHISLENARLQIDRIVAHSGLERSEVEEIVENNTEKRFLGIFGTDKLHVLKANLEIALKMGLIDGFEI